MANAPVSARSSGNPSDRLTGRELEVLELVVGGATNVELGERLGLSVHAVKWHLASVYRKLGVSNRTEAAATFLTAGLAQRGPVPSEELA